jgi:hypothetical protein
MRQALIAEKKAQEEADEHIRNASNQHNNSLYDYLLTAQATRRSVIAKLKARIAAWGS